MKLRGLAAVLLIGLLAGPAWAVDGMSVESGFGKDSRMARVGAHLLSGTTLGFRQFSTGFQFGSLLGVGYRFGPHGAYDLGMRVQHLSNADIKRPNDGMNFTEVRLQYWF